jgi:hypothetical protein
MARHTARRYAATLAFLIVPVVCQAQAPEIHGLTGGVVAGAMRWTLPTKRDDFDVMGGLHTGWRFSLRRWGAPRWTLTPHVSLMSTKFRGIPLHSTDVAVSRLDVGVQASVSVRRALLFGLAQAGRLTTEQYADTNLVNYHSGLTPAFGVGAHWPFNRACADGPELMIRHTKGDLKDGEMRPKGATPPPAGQIDAWIVTLGWSGRFRGTRLLFACR